MPEDAPPREVVIPLAEETLAVSRREVETGRVQVALTTETQTVVAREVLRGRRVEVERVPVGRTLAEARPLPCRTRKVTPSSSRSSKKPPWS